MMYSEVSRSMYIVTSPWQSRKSFRLMPMTKDCPFSEGIFDPNQKVLVMMSASKKPTYHMIPKLTENGDPLKLKTKRANGKDIAEKREVIDTYEEFYISEKAEISELIELIAVNANNYDWKSYLADPVEVKTDTGVALNMSETTEATA